SWYECVTPLPAALELTNWARAVLVLWPMEEPEGTFEFIAAKRGRRIGWAEKENYWSHADGDEIIWKPASVQETESAKASKNARKSKRQQPKTAPMLLPYLSETEWRSVAQVSELANDEDGKAGGISERRVVDMLKDLVELGKAELKEEPR